MATNIPPHQLGEVIDGVLALSHNPDITIAELMEYIPGPDFPTAGLILGRSGIRRAYETGRGSIMLRAKVEIEEKSNGKQSIIVTELPYQVNKARLIEKIAELVRDKKLKVLQIYVMNQIVMVCVLSWKYVVMLMQTYY